MRRLFIIRKDLQLHPGKLAAMVGHCAEGYWLNVFKYLSVVEDNEYDTLPVETPNDPDYWMRYRHPAVYEAAKAAHERGEKTFKFKAENSRPTKTISFEIPKEIWDGYINDIFTKTICEAKNLNHLMKVVDVAKELGLTEFHAKMEPKDKFSFLENLIKNKKKDQNIAFVGDGINDAPALRLADCGISMGLEGSPATVEASDVVLVDDNPAKLKELIDVSKNTRKIVIENIAFACIIKVLFLVLSAFGITNMFFAVFADVGVTVLCTLNSLRALFYHLPNKKQEHEHKHELQHKHNH